MIDLKDWIARNTRRPLVYALGTLLGAPQGTRPLVKSTLITGLRNSDAATAALCREGRTELLYPPGTEDPCRVQPTAFRLAD